MSPSDPQARVSWPGRLAVAVAVWLVGDAVLNVLGNHPDPVLSGLVVAVGAGVVWLFLDTSALAEPTSWPRPEPDPLRAPGQDPRAAMWQRVLAAHLDAREVSDQLPLRLGELADHRLVHRHGVTREGDPDRTARLLGDQVSAYLSSDHSRRLTLVEIDRIITRIEDL